MPIIRCNGCNIRNKVNHKAHYKGFLYIGYFTIDLYRKLKYKTKMLIKDNTDSLYKLEWYPVFVKLYEWYPDEYGRPKRYKLQRRSNGEKSTIEQKMETSRSRKR